MFDWIFTPEGRIALVSLVSLEIVLGIDNLIFISILVVRMSPKATYDFVLAFSLSVELLNIPSRKNTETEIIHLNRYI